MATSYAYKRENDSPRRHGIECESLKLTCSRGFHPPEVRVDFGLATEETLDGGSMCPSPDADARRPVVLVVDDERSITTLLGQILENEGFQAQAFSSSAAVSKQLADLLPNLVILDFEMPVFTGPELAVMLRRNATTEKVPIILLSGLTHEEHRLIGELSGATTYLTKPIDQARLVKVLRDILKHSGPL